MRDVTDAEIGSILAEAVKRAGTTSVIGAQLVPQIVGSVVELKIVDADDEFCRGLDLIRIKDRVFVPETVEVVPADVLELVIAGRIIAYQTDGADAEDHVRLDKALEAFADRVPWPDEEDANVANARRQFDEDDGA